MTNTGEDDETNDITPVKTSHGSRKSKKDQSEEKENNCKVCIIFWKEFIRILIG